VRALPALVVAAVLSGCGTDDLDPRDSGPDATTEAGPRDVRSFAVSFFRLGFTTRDGENVTDAWKKYGFNLDSVCTTPEDSQSSKNTCMRGMGSAGDVLTDGDDCIDNNFGAQLVTLIKAVDPAAETKIGDGIKSGALTLVFRLTDVAESGADDNAPGELFAAKAASGAAALDGTDVFDVDTISVEAGDINKPLARLKGSIAIENGKRVWHGTADALPLPAVFISGANGAIPIRGSHVAIDMDTGRGTIAGYAPVPQVQKVVSGVLSQQKLCPGTNGLHENILKNIERSADMPELLPHDPSKTCASLSIGLGVEVVAGSLGKIVPTGMPKPDPCAPKDAGPGDATADSAMDTSVSDGDATSDVTATDATDSSVEDVADSATTD